MEATITNLFYLKRAKANVHGLVPIYHRTTINGKRLDKSTGKFIDPTKWSTEAGRMKGSSEEARTINSHLDSLIANQGFVIFLSNLLSLFKPFNFLKLFGRFFYSITEIITN